MLSYSSITSSPSSCTDSSPIPIIMNDKYTEITKVYKHTTNLGNKIMQFLFETEYDFIFFTQSMNVFFFNGHDFIFKL